MQIKTLFSHFALALACALVACDPPAENDRPLPDPDMALAPADAPPLRLTLVDATHGLSTPPPGPFRLVAEDVRGQQARIELQVAEQVERWPHRAALEPLPAGTWRVTVYADRDDDGTYDGCPFPPEPAHAERADAFDNIVGIVEVQGGREAEVQVPLMRRICGPGDRGTGLEGLLLRPDTPELQGVPIRAVLLPEAGAAPRQADREDAPRAQALRFALFPDGAPADEAAFRVTELIPGRYRLQLFADNDGDGSASPCAGDMPGGGDRFVAEIGDIEIVAGEITAIERTVTLEPAPCPDPLTGITGAVTLPEGMAADGALRVEVTSVEGGPPIASTAQVESLRGRGLPHPFTVSGLPAGTWRVRVYLDRDGDRRFSPCAGMPSTVGFDHVSATVDDVVIAPGELLPLGTIALSDAACPPAAGIAGWVDVDVEPGALSSGRPVRLHLEPLDGGEPLSLQLFTDHVDRDGTEGRFGRRIPAGRYRARVYVDTDRDGELGPCDGDPYGDRAHSAPFDVEVGDEEILELPPIDVIALDCPVPEAALAPRLLLDGLDSLGEPPEAMLIEVREDGGWSTTHEVALEPAGAAEQSVERIELVPGNYTVSAFVDGDADGVLDTCDESMPDPYQARVSLTLDGGHAFGRPPLRPAPCEP